MIPYAAQLRQRFLSASCSGKTSSSSSAALSAMRRTPQLGHNPRYDVFAETADAVLRDASLPQYLQDNAAVNIVVIRGGAIRDLLASSFQQIWKAGRLQVYLKTMVLVYRQNQNPGKSTLLQRVRRFARRLFRSLKKRIPGLA